VNLESGVSLGTLLLTLGGVLVTGGIAWGALLQRVKTLEREVEALSGFAVSMAKVESEVGHIKSAIEQITGSWLFREPPSYVQANPHEPNPRRQR
jgi:dipeptide/tripeptide permease